MTLIPRPLSLTPGEGEYLLDPSTVISCPAALVDVADWLRTALRSATGLPLPAVDTVTESSVRLSFGHGLPVEGYTLVSGRHGVNIEGGSPAGAFYGCQALLQLLPPEVYRHAPVSGVRWSLPAVTITDEPRFAWRGAMLDVARHFLPKHDLLRFIDLMAMHRLNTLHLHLTDDQGWRIEIRRYPRLTEVGSWRRESQVGAPPDSPSDGRPHGGFYSQADLREIVAYAAARFVTIVPEIDVPGHSQAAIAAYSELGVSGEDVEVSTRWGVNPTVLNTEDSTVEFYANVIDEVMDLFPGPYIGIGGDECPKDQWEADPRSQELIRERGLADEVALQAWFIGQLADRITARGRRPFGWDELLEGDAPPAGATIASWRGMAGAVTAARKGFDVVSCPDQQAYLDYRQSDDPNEPIPFGTPLTVADVYAFEPVPPELTADEATHILGGQANIWTEQIDSPRTIDYLAFPRLCAMAEALWSAASTPEVPSSESSESRPRDFDDFHDRLQTHLRRLDAVGVEYRGEKGPRPWQTRPGIAGLPWTRAERDQHTADLLAQIQTDV